MCATLKGAQPVVCQHAFEQRANLSLRTRRDDNPTAAVGGKIRTVVDQVFGSAACRMMVKEFNTEAFVYDEDPVARIMYLVQECLLISFQDKRRDRTELEPRLGSRDTRGSR